MLVVSDVGVISSSSRETLKKCPVAHVSIIVGGEGEYCVELI
jgi:hypothetical protein